MNFFWGDRWAKTYSQSVWRHGPVPHSGFVTAGNVDHSTTQGETTYKYVLKMFKNLFEIGFCCCCCLYALVVLCSCVVCV